MVGLSFSRQGPGVSRWLIAGLAALIFAAGSLGASPKAWAVEPDEILEDPVLEGRARALSQELRCLVCRNESIDESNAPLARDLRILVRERLKAGDTDAEIIDLLRERYGDYVLLEPPLKQDTALLWVAPAMILLIGAFAMIRLFRQHRPADDLEDGQDDGPDGESGAKRGTA